MKKTLLSLIIMVSIFSTAQAVDTKQDLTDLRAKAEKGDALLQLEYGKAIRDKSKEEASIWIQKAADQGSGEAWFWLGYAGLGKEKPVFYYKKAAEIGYPKAYEDLLDDLIFRAGSSADIQEAKRFADLTRKFGIKLYDADAKFKTIDRCYEAGSATLPASDQPTPQEIDAFKISKADCQSFQTGIGAEQDWNNYRKCLLSKNVINNNDLAEIYANGWGVKRNPKLAMALVCRGSDVPAELEYMVETLYSTRNEEQLKKDFYFCNHITSGMSGTKCAAGKAAIKDKERDLELSNLTSQWTESQKNAFYVLQKAANDFFSEHSGSENDMSGTASAAMAISKEARLKDKFIKDIKKFDSGEIPKDDDFTKADKELNVLYNKIMKSNIGNDSGTIKKNGIKKTQKKWIKYRDAWVKFVEIRYPDHSAALWKTWLTRQRIDQLNKLLPLLD